MAAPAEFFSFHETDIDAAQAAVGKNYFIARMDLLDRASLYEFRFDGVSIGALSLGRAWYNASIDVTMADLQTCYYVNFPAAGSMHASHRRSTLEVTPGRGALYQPSGPVHMRTSDDYDSYALRIDRRTLENEFKTLLEHPVGTPLLLDLDLTRGPGASWSRLLAALAREAAQQDILFTYPLAASPLHDALISGLLHAAGHRWRDELDRPSRSWAPRPVRRAVEALHAHPEFPHTPASLAATASISVRALHEAFRRHIGMTPMTYLRQLRLQHAHNELSRSEPADTTVTDTARRWGFTHLPRFAQAYQQRYGQSPSTTLRHAVPTVPRSPYSTWPKPLPRDARARR